MNINLKTLYSIYRKPKALITILSVVVGSGLIALVFCHEVTHRYAMTALVKIAEVGQSANPTGAAAFSPFGGKTTPSLGNEALAYLEFQYLGRNRNPKGVRLVEAKELKTSDTIQLVAEGPTMEAIQDFLKDLLTDLQNKYKPTIDSALEQGTQEVKFLNREIASLETLKSQVEDGIHNIGPAPALVSQVMEINQNLVKLKQDYFFKSSLISSDKVHNFKLDTLAQMGEGAPVWPKTKQTMSFSMIMALVLGAYGVFLGNYFGKRKRAKRIMDLGWKSNVPTRDSPVVTNVDILRDQ